MAGICAAGTAASSAMYSSDCASLSARHSVGTLPSAAHAAAACSSAAPASASAEAPRGVIIARPADVRRCSVASAWTVAQSELPR
jgi:hypothetical protein